MQTPQKLMKAMVARLESRKVSFLIGVITIFFIRNPKKQKKWNGYQDPFHNFLKRISTSVIKKQNKNNTKDVYICFTFFWNGSRTDNIPIITTSLKWKVERILTYKRREKLLETSTSMEWAWNSDLQRRKAGIITAENTFKWKRWKLGDHWKETERRRREQKQKRSREEEKNGSRRK